MFLIVGVLTLRLIHGDTEVDRGLDTAAANMVTYAAVILASITLWAWFSFRSTYPVPLRRTAMSVGLVVAAALMGSVRLEGITGNWIPTGVRWSWQKPREFARPSSGARHRKAPARRSGGHARRFFPVPRSPAR